MKTGAGGEETRTDLPRSTGLPVTTFAPQEAGFIIPILEMGK